MRHAAADKAGPRSEHPGRAQQDGEREKGRIPPGRSGAGIAAASAHGDAVGSRPAYRSSFRSVGQQCSGRPGVHVARLRHPVQHADPPFVDGDDFGQLEGRHAAGGARFDPRPVWVRLQGRGYAHLHSARRHADPDLPGELPAGRAARLVGCSRAVRFGYRHRVGGGRCHAGRARGGAACGSGQPRNGQRSRHDADLERFLGRTARFACRHRRHRRRAQRRDIAAVGRGGRARASRRTAQHRAVPARDADFGRAPGDARGQDHQRHAQFRLPVGNQLGVAQPQPGRGPSRQPDRAYP